VGRLSVDAAALGASRHQLSAIKSDDKMVGRAESGGGLRAATKQPALLLPLGGTDRHEKLLNLFPGDRVGRTRHVIIAA
jgi:hypothetical protein